METLSLVDHHVHGPFRASIGRARFENALNEGRHGSLPRLRERLRLAARLRRTALVRPPARPRSARLARRLLDPSGRAGGAGGEPALPRRGRCRRLGRRHGLRLGGRAVLDELRAVTGGAVHEIVRLETIAADLLAEGPRRRIPPLPCRPLGRARWWRRRRQEHPRLPHGLRRRLRPPGRRGGPAGGRAQNRHARRRSPTRRSSSSASSRRPSGPAAADSRRPR